MSEIQKAPVEIKDRGLLEKHHWEQKSDILNLDKSEKEIRTKVLERLQPRTKQLKNWEDIQYIIELFFDEIYTNALLHGNYGELGPKDQAMARAVEKHKANPEKYLQKKILTDVQIGNQNFTISIQDEGEGFNNEDVPDPLEDKNLLKTSGRGLFATNELAKQNGFEDLKIENLAAFVGKGHGSRVTLEYKLNKKEAA